MSTVKGSSELVYRMISPGKVSIRPSERKKSYAVRAVTMPGLSEEKSRDRYANCRLFALKRAKA